MSVSDTPNAKSGLTKKKLVIQITGFLIGISLLVWCIKEALAKGDFSKLREADPAIVFLMILCTLTSIIANGTIFWAIIRPMLKLKFWDLQFINSVVNILNYAPVRLGLITRLYHHKIVDKLSYFQLIAWYAAFAALYFLMLGALLGSTLARPAIDVLWLVFLLIILISGAVFFILFSANPRIIKRLRGADRMLSHPGYVSTAMLLRLVDVMAYTARLYLAFKLLNIDLTLRDTILLTLISMVGNLAPAGALGIREFLVAFFGPYIAGGSLASQIDSSVASAILIDRAAEVVVFIPLGIISLEWMRRKWKTARQIPLT